MLDLVPGETEKQNELASLISFKPALKLCEAKHFKDETITDETPQSMSLVQC